MKHPQASWCPECGPVKVDEDGCCAACGCGAMGPWADKAAALYVASKSPVATAERAVVRAAVVARERTSYTTLDCLARSVDRLLAARAKAKKGARK